MLPCNLRLSFFWWFGSPRHLQSVDYGIVVFVVCFRRCGWIFVTVLGRLGWSVSPMTLVGSFLLAPETRSRVERPCPNLLRPLCRVGEVSGVMWDAWAAVLGCDV